MKPRQFKKSYPSMEELARDLNIIGNNEPTFDMTLETGTASTVISNQMVGINSVITFMPTSTTAATEMNVMYVSSRGKQTFTVTHSNSGDADRTFTYFVFG